jgi:hypothetical protein
MPTTYASLEAVEAFLAAGDFSTSALPGTDADKESMIRDAEADVDRVLGFNVSRSLTTGRKLDPATLSVAQVAALERAVCLQTVWRLEVGDEALAGLDDDVTAAEGLTVGPQARPPSPAAVEALAGMGFPWSSGYASPPDPEGE